VTSLWLAGPYGNCGPRAFTKIQKPGFRKSGRGKVYQRIREDEVNDLPLISGVRKENVVLEILKLVMVGLRNNYPK
jgi:hypothetical protein